VTDKEVLTQDEIDALLTGVDDGDVDVAVLDDSSADVADYDLTNQDKVVRGRMPTLELIAERFARQLRADLPNCMKFPIEVGPGGVQIIKYADYVDTLFVPTCIKLVRIHPFEGTCLVTLDAKLVHRMVDLFFGGTGSVSSFEGKEFTQTEQRVISRIVDLVLSDYQDAWEDVLPIQPEILGEEVNPSLINVLSPSEVLMVCSFRLELDDGGGELHIAFPYASLEPYKSILDTTNKTDKEETDGRWRSQMELALLGAQLPVSCVIGDAEMRLRELMNMQVGDVIDLNMQDLHQVSIGEMPAFVATLGDSRGKFALEFESFTRD